MLLVFTPKITPRINYIFKHIFVRVLNVPFKLTTKIEDFIAHNGPKFSYSDKQLGKEIHVKSHGLLTQQGIEYIDLDFSKWKDAKIEYRSEESTVILFDIFAFSFYLISRYEEYLPHTKDIHGRFKSDQSIAYINGFLESPLIDIWAYDLLDLLSEKYSEISVAGKQYKYISTINIDSAYVYKNKGLIRSVGGFIYDFFTLKLKNVLDRFLVILGLSKDPYDTFGKIIELQKKHNIKTIFFFLTGSYTNFDNNISISRNNFKMLIKNTVDYSLVGIMASYFSMDDDKMLKKQKKDLENITNTNIIKSRQHYLRVSIPETYRILIDSGITEDYSMGYDDNIGFKASTCTPFFFYDINYEFQTSLKIFPFAFADKTLIDGLRYSEKTALDKIKTIREEVQKVNGTLVSVFHNETLSGTLHWKSLDSFYYKMLKIVKE
ncbi:MAG: hypothetical protein HRT66_04495 [Flavobacteriaceae bacterium]|nr:hypothetical protein [Flavobacteriaceae bacterium]